MDLNCFFVEQLFPRLKEKFDILGNTLIRFLAELDEKIDTTLISVQYICQQPVSLA